MARPLDRSHTSPTPTRGSCGGEADAFRDVPRPGGDPSGRIPLGGILLANKKCTESVSPSSNSPDRPSPKRLPGGRAFNLRRSVLGALGNLVRSFRACQASGKAKLSQIPTNHRSRELFHSGRRVPHRHSTQKCTETGAPSSGLPTDLRRSDCLSESHQPQALRPRCNQDTTGSRAPASSERETQFPLFADFSLQSEHTCVERRVLYIEQDQGFAEPGALSSTSPADLPLPRTASRESFVLLASRARRSGNLRSGTHPRKGIRRRKGRKLRTSGDGLNGKHVVVTGAGTGIGRAIAAAARPRGRRADARSRAGASGSRRPPRRSTAPVRVAPCDIRQRRRVERAIDAGGGARSGRSTRSSPRAGSAARTATTTRAATASTTSSRRISTGRTTASGRCSSTSRPAPTRGTSWCCRRSSRGSRCPATRATARRRPGLLGLVRSFAAELAPRGVQVNAICPGWVDTDMAWLGLDAAAEASGGTREDAYRDAMRRPAGRMSQPEDVAGTVSWLLSPDARGVTGQAIDQNGGAWMRGLASRPRRAARRRLACDAGPRPIGDAARPARSPARVDGSRRPRAPLDRPRRSSDASRRTGGRSTR